MTIEIHQPELEALIQQRMASGRYQTIEDALLSALKSAPVEKAAVAPKTIASTPPEETLDQMFAKVRGLLTDEEVDTLFCRDPSPGRIIDFS